MKSHSAQRKSHSALNVFTIGMSFGDTPIVLECFLTLLSIFKSPDKLFMAFFQF